MKKVLHYSLYANFLMCFFIVSIANAIDSDKSETKIMGGVNRVSNTKDIEIVSFVDKKIVHMNDTIKYTIMVINISDPPDPVPAEMDWCKRRDRETSTHYSYINKKTVCSKEFIYRLYPIKKGWHTIRPAELNYNGKIYRTNPVIVRVIDAKEPEAQYQYLHNNLFIKQELDKKFCYLGERVMLTTKLYNCGLHIEDVQYSPPKFTDFEIKKMEAQDNYYITIKNKEFAVSELKFELTPLHSGKFIIPSAKADLTILLDPEANEGNYHDKLFNKFLNNKFFGREDKKKIPFKIESNEIELFVKIKSQ